MCVLMAAFIIFKGITGRLWVFILFFLHIKQFFSFKSTILLQNPRVSVPLGSNPKVMQSRSTSSFPLKKLSKTEDGNHIPFFPKVLFFKLNIPCPFKFSLKFDEHPCYALNNLHFPYSFKTGSQSCTQYDRYGRIIT